MIYQAKNFDYLLGLEGFSDQSLKNHFALYQGYVNNVNKAEDRRRFGWEFNGMRLHEYYFEAMTKDFTALSKDSELYKNIEKNFGGFEAWEKDFKALAMMRGMGWAILYYDKTADKLFNVWINEHDTGHLAGEKIILNLDVFEHAFITDYGLKRADYIEAFFKVIDWGAVARRMSY
jgi:superoxide dismutase, Fe-Mn family